MKGYVSGYLFVLVACFLSAAAGYNQAYREEIELLGRLLETLDQQKTQEIPTRNGLDNDEQSATHKLRTAARMYLARQFDDSWRASSTTPAPTVSVPALPPVATTQSTSTGGSGGSGGWNWGWGWSKRDFKAKLLSKRLKKQN